MFDEAFLESVKNELAKIECDFSEAFLKRSTGLVISKEQDCETSESANDSGAGVRIRKGDDWSFSHVSTGDPDEILSFVKGIAAGKKTVDPGSANICAGVDDPPENSEEIQGLLSETADLMKERGASFFLGLLKAGTDEWSIISGEGNIVSDKKSRTTFYSQVAMRKSGRAAKGAECSMEMRPLSEIPLKEFVGRVAEESCRLSRIHLEAIVSPEGEMDVVLASKASGMIIHEAVGHIFEADNYKKGNAGEFLGTMIASDCFSLSEKGPADEFASFDDEGGKPTGQILIESGKAVGLISDLRTSRELDIPLTGNARRENHRFEPLPRIWRLESPAGEASDAELCSEMTIGLYIKRLSDGKVDMAKREAFFPVAEGYLVRDGRIAEAVTKVGIAVRIPDFLQSITAVGNEKESAWGLCVKRSQAVWTSESIPSLKLTKAQVRRLESPD